MRYQLIAQNIQGATTIHYGNSKADALRSFDSEYSRAGFMIEVIDTHNFKSYKIKKTYR